MQFASVHPDNFDGTIEYGDCRVNRDECYGCVYCDDDVEIPFEPTNPLNEIIFSVRECRVFDHADTLECIEEELAWFNSSYYQRIRDEWTPAEEHAYRVFTKFKAVYG